MKNVRLLLLSAATLFASALVAQDAEYTLSAAGTLADVVPAAEYATIKSLKVNGSVDARDIFFMRDSLTALTSIDMTDATILSYENSTESYEADAIPACAFSDPLMDVARTKINTFLFPVGTKKIGDYAFYLCSGLRAHNFDQLTSLQYIGTSAFSRNNRLRELVLPASVQEIGSSAFAGCTSLTSFSLTENSQLEVIGNNVFMGNTKIESLDFTPAASLNKIGARAFSGCTKLTSVILPTSVQEIGEEAFMYTSIASVDWSLLNLKMLSGSTFYGASNLKEIKLPWCVTEVGASAFTGCTSLKSIDLSNKLTLIGDYAFSGCTALTNIFCPAETVPVVGYNAFENISPANVTVKVDENLLSQYEESIYWDGFNFEGVSLAGINDAQLPAMKHYRTGNTLVIEAEEVIASVAIYDYSGRLVAQHSVADTTARISLPQAKAHYLARVSDENGISILIK